MKKKVHLLLMTFFVIQISNLYSQEILVQNNEHVIYYTISGDKITFIAEDLKDNENNSSGNESGHNTYCGMAAETYPNKFSYYFTPGQIMNGQYDECSIEIDVYNNQNYKQFTGKAAWQSSKYNSYSHLIWNIEIPLKDILVTDNFDFKVRAFISRVAQNHSSNVNYTTFYYPNQTCRCDGSWRVHVATNNNAFFNINLTNSNLPIIAELKQKQGSNREKEELINLMSDVYNNLVSIEAYKKASIQVPEFAGVYVVTSEGKYIEIPDNSFVYGAVWCGNGTLMSSGSHYRSSKVPFYYSEDFKQVSKLRIKKSDFIEFKVNASGGELNVNLKYLTLHPIKKLELRPVTNCVLFIAENDKAVEKINNTIFYFDEEVKLQNYSEANNVYRYAVPNGLSNGLYGFWLNNIVWLIEII